MKLIPFLSVLCLVVFTSCNQSTSETRIAKNQLGLLNPKTQISELNAILERDSVAEFDLRSNLGTTKEIEIYNEQGDLSLIIEPNYQGDSLVTISEIQILDPKYKTDKGLTIESPFKMIYENYKIDNIQNSINSVILSINEIGVYLVIDKKHLPSKLRFDSEIKIEANQIPDGAPFKYFWLRFDETTP
ncbi:DUF1131 domain-containing protein [Psychroflexus sp. YR1-1]|uniref:DUF1131 domain-containing protein n=1 Tax=Psychroflexus aurantiacus TaxID=2709310 RepID=A0A6B3R1A7_9FLAO|nr:DUF1131 family protein [Psychroflexus aurantiacus]NEV93798.1 DUF1131 domain-containing protein [Psychroflexus aurantiacus]